MQTFVESGIFDAIQLGSGRLPPVDPFADLCPLMEVTGPRDEFSLTSLFPEELNCFRGNDDIYNDDDLSDWEADGDGANDDGENDDGANDDGDGDV